MSAAARAAALLVAAMGSGGSAGGAPDCHSPFHALREAARRELLDGGEPGRAAALAGLGDPDYRVRRLCLEALARLAKAEDLPVIARSFKDRSESVRLGAIESFLSAGLRVGGAGPEGALAAGAIERDLDAAVRRIVSRELLAIFELPNPTRWSYDRRFRTLMALGPRAGPALRDAARDLRLAPSVRATAIVALARLGEPGDAGFLLALGRAERERRYRLSGELQETEREPLAAVAAALAFLGPRDPEAIGFLAESANHGSNPLERNWALWALLVAADDASREDRERIAKVLREVLDSERDAGVLDLDTQGLVQLGVREAVPLLLESAERRLGGYVVWSFVEAAWLLSAADPAGGDAEADSVRATVVQAFERITQRGQPPAVAYARVCLGKAKEGRAELVQRLYRLLEGSESTEEDDAYLYGPRTACLALALLGETDAVKPIVKACESAHDELRLAAMLALGRLGGPAALPALKGGLGDPSEFNRLQVAQVLLGLGERDAIAVLIDELMSGIIWARRTALLLLAPIRGGETDGFEARAGVAARREAVARWRAWWEREGASVKWNSERGAFEQR